MCNFCTHRLRRSCIEEGGPKKKKNKTQTKRTVTTKLCVWWIDQFAFSQLMKLYGERKRVFAQWSWTESKNQFYAFNIAMDDNIHTPHSTVAYSACQMPKAPFSRPKFHESIVAFRLHLLHIVKKKKNLMMCGKILILLTLDYCYSFICLLSSA